MRIYGENTLEEQEIEEPVTQDSEDDGDFELAEAATSGETATVEEQVTAGSRADDEQVCAICYYGLSVKVKSILKILLNMHFSAQ